MLVGFMLAGWVSSLSVPKGSGLAGPGIVAGYALFGAVGGFAIAIVLILKATARKIVIINLVFGLVILIPIIFFLRQMATRDDQAPEPAPKTTVPVVYQQHQDLGLGMAKPDFFNNSVIYFYAPNLEKATDEHIPIDSLVFKETEMGRIISYAPPWFYPAHMKIDYGILFLKTISQMDDWVQVEVNQQSGLTYWLDATKASVIPWPEVLLNAFSVESDLENNPLRVRPFDHGSPIEVRGNIFEPFEVKEEWIRVFVLDNNLNRTGEGWLRWKRGNQLLVKYYLLS